MGILVERKTEKNDGNMRLDRSDDGTKADKWRTLHETSGCDMMGEVAFLRVCVFSKVHIRPNCIGRSGARNVDCLPRYLHNTVVSDPRGPSQARCGSEHADNDS